MWGIIVALISGLLMSVQGVMNTGVTKQTSLWVSAGLGPAKSVMLIVIMQIVSAYVIELMGILGTDKAKFYWGKVIGAAIAVTGVIIFFMCGEKNIK